MEKHIEVEESIPLVARAYGEGVSQRGPQQNVRFGSIGPFVNCIISSQTRTQFVVRIEAGTVGSRRPVLDVQITSMNGDKISSTYEYDDSQRLFVVTYTPPVNGQLEVSVLSSANEETIAQVHIALNGTPILNSPYRVYVTPMPIDVSRVRVRGPGVSSDEVLTAGNNTFFEVVMPYGGVFVLSAFCNYSNVVKARTRNCLRRQ